jgi:pyruvate/2-oxoacid:ferredoxin oxidoreductase alpha subunit
MSFNLDLAVFVPRSETGDLSIFAHVDALVKPIAAEKKLMRWHPYDTEKPYRCVEQLPMAFLTQEGVWHEYDPEQEKATQRLIKKRKKAYAEIAEEEKQAHDEDTAASRTLVRFALWAAEHPFPLGAFRQVWRQALLDHASMIVVYIACERLVPLDESEK